MSLYDKINHQILTDLISPAPEPGLGASISELCKWQTITAGVILPYTEAQILAATATITARCRSGQQVQIVWTTIQNALEGNLEEAANLSAAERETLRTMLLETLFLYLSENYDGYPLISNILHALHDNYSLDELSIIALLPEDWTPPEDIRSICQNVFNAWINFLMHPDNFPDGMLESVIPPEVFEYEYLLDDVLEQINLLNYETDSADKNLLIQILMRHSCCNSLSQSANNILQN